MVERITVPRLNNNDTSYVLVEWLFPEGERVTAGDPVAAVETAKAVEELVAETGGVLHRAKPAGADCRPGDVLGFVFADSSAHQEFLRESAAADSPGAGPELIITEPARALLDRHAVDPERLRALGRPLIRRADVEELLAAGATTAESGRLSRRQRATANVVAESHRTIPAAFVLARIDASGISALRRKIAASGETPFDLGTLIVAVAARLRPRFPDCFAGLGADGTVHRPEVAHVGVTVDLGSGLFVPVVEDAEHRSLPEIAAVIRDQRRRAAGSELRAEELGGGNLSVSISDYTEIVLSIPFVLPGQTCMLSVCGLRSELRDTGRGTFERRPYFHLGLSYDHRVVNGRYAAQFLRAIRIQVEQPQLLTGLLR
ncbi:2-oxo acid dehydrogenase subunit E2 [Amycolatopsis anabasis]|uniref:2-oxo acid dehydrogenase subunit E2 n=1 Tax=Amycolatopsis anabasis TaxID=1840409 RepID=UPI00131C8BAC|nr:2-oxo acid dehydrogenase subunit E2 [Amycolatopsis anabasis]